MCVLYTCTVYVPHILHVMYYNITIYIHIYDVIWIHSICAISQFFSLGFLNCRWHGSDCQGCVQEAGINACCQAQPTLQSHWLRCRLGCLLLRSSRMCLRGLRSVSRPASSTLSVAAVDCSLRREGGTLLILHLLSLHIYFFYPTFFSGCCFDFVAACLQCIYIYISAVVKKNCDVTIRYYVRMLRRHCVRVLY